MPSLISGNQLRSTTTEVTASAAVQLFDDPATQAPGALVYRDSGRTLANKLFKRTGPTVTTLAIPYLRAYVADAYGAIYASQSAANFKFDTLRHSDDASEEALTTVATDANGKADWNYTIAASDTAFNRWKTALNTVDNTASPPMSVAAADVDAEDPYGLADSDGPYPAYPKHVKLSGNGFSSGKEPSVTVEDVFGVNSEAPAVALGMYTADGGENIDNADGVPTGAARTSMPLGSGALLVKPLTAEISGGVIVDATRSALRDVAGRPIVTTTDLWFLRWGVWNTTSTPPASQQAMANMSDAGADDMRLQGSYGYSPNFATLAAPDNPGRYAIIVGYADTSAQRSTLTMTSDTAYGYSGDAGNYGAHAIEFDFIINDPDLFWVITALKKHLHQGDTTTIQARMARWNSSHGHNIVTPDAALHIVGYRLGTAGQVPTLVVDEAMTEINSTTFEYAFSETTLGVYAFFVTGTRNLSRPADTGRIDLFVLDTKHQHDKKPLSVGSSS